MSKNLNMSSSIKETKFDAQKQQNSNNDTASTVNSTTETKPEFELVNYKLKSLLTTDISEDSRKAINFIVEKFKFKPVSYLTPKSVVLFGNEAKKVTIKFVRIFL